MWMNRPGDEKSVSLTLLVCSGILVAIAGGLEVFGVTKTTSVFPELLYTAAGLYFGRRFDLSALSKESKGKVE